VDHATAVPGQVRVGVLGVQQITANVDVHHPVVVGQRRVDQPGGHRHAGVVHQHLEAAEMLGGCAHRRRDRVRVGGVRGDEAGPRPQRPPGTLTQIPVATGDRHPRTLPQEALGYRQAQTGGAAGDQSALPLQQAHGRTV
jgi:hypothetical protein